LEENVMFSAVHFMPEIRRFVARNSSFMAADVQLVVENCSLIAESSQTNFKMLSRSPQPLLQNGWGQASPSR
jgi:hypothetical protein